jgi:GR25 family glycosyltransferase involved in LPS biosynthesis
MSEVRYSICVPYFRRPEHLHNTLLSFRHFYGGRKDWEMVIAEDAKDGDGDSEALKAVLGCFPELPVVLLEVIAFGMSHLMNLAVKAAEGDVIVLTSPECVHMTDVLGFLDRHFERSPGTYIVMACADVAFSGRQSVFPFKVEQGKWYQHSMHSNQRLHFCSAISQKQYWEVGGMCEDFDVGVCYEDDDFRDKVVHADIGIVTEDSVWVAHQHHNRVCSSSDFSEKEERNRKLYVERHWDQLHVDGDKAYHAGKAKDAFLIWLQGAKLGHPQCMKNVVWAYDAGVGVEPNREEMEKWKETIRERLGASVINRHFDAVFYVNLDRRPDRREKIEAQLKARGIKAERFPGVCDPDMPERGCYLSHRNIAREALKRGLKTYFVFEDDALIPEDFDARVTDGMTDLPKDWDGVYLGAWYWIPPSEDQQAQKPVQANGCCYRVFRAYTTVAYGIRVDGKAVREIAESGYVGVPFDDFMVRMQLRDDVRFYAVMEPGQIGSKVIGFVGHDTELESDIRPGRDRRLEGDKLQFEGDNWFHGVGKEPNYRKAVHFWAEGAKLGSFQCVKNMAWAYTNGFGVPQDEVKAKEWGLRVAEMEALS